MDEMGIMSYLTLGWVREWVHFPKCHIIPFIANSFYNTLLFNTMQEPKLQQFYADAHLTLPLFI